VGEKEVLLVAKLILFLIEKLQYKHINFMDELYNVVLPHRFAKCGRDVHLYYPVRITGWKSMVIGNNVHVNRNAFIRAEGGLKIGDNVHIGSNLVIYTINHNYIGRALPYDHTVIRKKVSIEKNVWIGMGVTIVPGVSIGEGAVIGAGTVVTRDVPSLAVIGSRPPRIIKYRDRNHYMELESKHLYGGIEGRLYRSNYDCSEKL
jgi:acetyltransferase-like isoleucine patch superfamily enzyme